jgi:ssDNA-binding Zn-finger/Zn-ribbon topoisomerase 1
MGCEALQFPQDVVLNQVPQLGQVADDAKVSKDFLQLVQAHQFPIGGDCPHDGHAKPSRRGARARRAAIPDGRKICTTENKAPTANNPATHQPKTSWLRCIAFRAKRTVSAR